MTSARERAERLLAETALFDELGLNSLAAQSRCVARDVLDLAAQVEQERSTRQALQQRCETLQAIVGKAAYQALSR